MCAYTKQLLPAAVAAASSVRSRSFSCRNCSSSFWWCRCSSAMTCLWEVSISAKLRSHASYRKERQDRGRRKKRHLPTAFLPARADHDKPKDQSPMWLEVQKSKALVNICARYRITKPLFVPIDQFRWANDFGQLALIQGKIFPDTLWNQKPPQCNWSG